MIFPAAPQHVVLDEARRRLAVVHPAAQRRDELRRRRSLGCGGSWTCGTVGNFSMWKKVWKKHHGTYGKIWKTMENMENYGKYGKIIKKHMENYGKLYGKLWTQIEDLTDVY